MRSPAEIRSPLGKFVVIHRPNDPIGAVGERRRVCPHCHLPTYAGRAMHQHCRVLLSNRRRVEEGKALGRYVAETLWSCLPAEFIAAIADLTNHINAAQPANWRSK